MAIVVRCPDCGTVESLPDTQAGAFHVCGVCRREYDVPGMPMPAEPSARGQDPAEPEARKPRKKRVMAVLTVACILGVAGAGGYYWRYVWEQVAYEPDRQIAASLDQDARNFLKNDQTAEARVRLVELSEFLAPRVAHDPKLRQLADQAATELALIDRARAAKAAAQQMVADAQRASVAGAVAPPRPIAVHQELPKTLPVTVAAVQVTPPTPDHGDPTPPAPPTRPPVREVPMLLGDPSDEQIGKGIQRGVDFLYSAFDPQTFELRGGIGFRGKGKKARLAGANDGEDVLALYALMQCNEAISDPRLNMRGSFMVGAIEMMKTMPLDDVHGTYSRGLRSTALAMHNRKEDVSTMRDDVTSLIKTSHKGGYTYFSNAAGSGDGAWDNSNSQYGLLGVWSGAESEIEVPMTYWTDVEKHWTTCQNADGGWGYTRDGSKLTMTCAGVASMFVCHDWIDAPKFAGVVGREPFSPTLKKGLDWLETGDRCVQVGGPWGYSLYGVERVGLASGFKFFGKHNWYPELARQVLSRQQPNGSWGDPVDTAYALLFLARGRHPVLMNKLRYNGYWANRPRDAANLAKYASEQVEQPLNWQVVPITADWTDWTDSPILYISSHVPPKLAEGDIDKIRQFVLAGGMLYVQADGGANSMTGFATELGHQLFPRYEMTDVPPGHPLFNSVYRIETSPPLRMLSNGSRILMLYSPTDISRHWQLREQNARTGKPLFQLGINMFIYAAGRRDLRNRLDSNILPDVKGEASLKLKIARVTYAGHWDPEPYAWTRFARWFASKTNYKLNVEPVAMRDLDARTYPFAHLTGTAAYRASSDEVAAVKKYVEDGGVLLIDLTGGTGAFDESIRTSLISTAFPAAAAKYVRAPHPLMVSGPSGMEDLRRPRLRPYAVEKLGSSGGGINIFNAGKGHVLFTSIDLTSGLLNTNTWGIIGYEPNTSQPFMKNLILWTVDGQKDD